MCKTLTFENAKDLVKWVNDNNIKKDDIVSFIFDPNTLNSQDKYGVYTVIYFDGN